MSENLLIANGMCGDFCLWIVIVSRLKMTFLKLVDTCS